MYSIKEASALCGVSKDMIRHYEKLGIVLPKRNQSNGYRMYSDSDLNLITLVKLYSTLGVELKTCAKIVTNKDISSGLEQLSRRIEELEYQQDWLKQRLRFSRRVSGSLAGYLAGEKHRIVQASDIVLYPREQISAEADGYARLIASAPIFSYYYRVRMQALLASTETAYPSDVGIFVEGSAPLHASPGEILRRAKVYQTWLTLEKGAALTPKHVNPMLKDIQALGYQVSGDLILYQILGSNRIDDPTDVLCIEIGIE